MGIRFFALGIMSFFFYLPLYGSDTSSTCSPVKVNGKQLLCFSTGIDSLNAEERAKNADKKLQSIMDDYRLDIDSIAITEKGGLYFITASDTPLFALGPQDLHADGEVSPGDYSFKILRELKNELQISRHSFDFDTLGRGLLYSTLITLFLVLAIYLINQFAAFIKRRLLAKTETYVQKLRIKNYQFISAYRLNQLAGGVVWLARALTILSILYFYVPLVLSMFPVTAKFSTKIVSMVWKPFQEIFFVIWNYIPNILYIFAIFLVTHYLVRILKLIFNEIELGNLQFSSFHPEWAQPTLKLIKFLFYSLALVMMFPYLPGSSSPAFQGMSVFIGVLISFGSGSAIANIISGVVITYMRPFKLGDRVKISDTIGDVIERNFLITRIRTIKNVDVTIPNSMVLGSHINNFSAQAKNQGLILNTSVTIGYSAPWAKVHELLKEAARRTKLIAQEKEPFILQTALNDFYVSYELNAYTNHANEMAQIYSDLHQNIQNTFNEGGVEIMSPHYHALRDGAETTIPNLAKNESR